MKERYATNLKKSLTGKNLALFLHQIPTLMEVCQASLQQAEGIKQLLRIALAFSGQTAIVPTSK